MKKVLSWLVVVLLLLAYFYFNNNASNVVVPDDNGTLQEITDDESGQETEQSQGQQETEKNKNKQKNISENGHYTSKEDVALYLHLYGHLPKNFISKNQAKKLGWSGGSLEPYAPGCSIGGSFYGNYEGILPEGHEYHECDIDTMHAKSRGAKRIVYSDDGLIFYTGDHYETFELLYGEVEGWN